MKILAFLGNPGKKYEKNRHNAGFMAGAFLAEKYGIAVKKKDFNSVCGQGKIEGSDVLLLFPNTYMNNSGQAVKAAMDYYGETQENLLVIHDEIELPFGELRIKTGGGHKGHNGIRSIIQHTGNPDFQRLRIGVGRPLHPQMEVADYLLSDFTGEELNGIKELSPRITEMVVSMLGK